MAGLIVLLDADNTLLDNELVFARLEERLSGLLGAERSARFWEIYEQVRSEFDFVNFPAAVERFGRECANNAVEGDVMAALYSFAFRDCVFEQSWPVVRHVQSFATPVIVSDGDQLFQRYKIRAAGLEEAVDGNVLIYVHKERETSDIRERFPAEHYVMVDDKVRILAAMKEAMGESLTTVMVCQGRYAHDPDHHNYPDPDITIEGIGGFLGLGAGQLQGASGRSVVS